MEEIEQRILNLIKKEKGISSTVIAQTLREDYWKIKNYLRDLEDEKLIEKLEKSKGQTFWRIKNAKK